MQEKSTINRGKKKGGGEGSIRTVTTTRKRVLKTWQTTHKLSGVFFTNFILVHRVSFKNMIKMLSVAILVLLVVSSEPGKRSSPDIITSFCLILVKVDPLEVEPSQSIFDANNIKIT